MPDWLVIPHSRLAAVYADLGQEDAARREVDWILNRDPKATTSDFTRIFRFRDPGKVNWYAGLLRQAGLPSEWISGECASTLRLGDAVVIGAVRSARQRPAMAHPCLRSDLYGLKAE
jgi:hypothetical protein